MKTHEQLKLHNPKLLFGQLLVLVPNASTVCSTSFNGESGMVQTGDPFTMDIRDDFQCMIVKKAWLLFMPMTTITPPPISNPERQCLVLSNKPTTTEEDVVFFLRPFLKTLSKGEYIF